MNINYIICSVILRKKMALSVLLSYLNSIDYTGKIIVAAFFQITNNFTLYYQAINYGELDLFCTR